MCNNNGLCTENEDCRCSDCAGQPDSCNAGLLCASVASYASVANTMVCVGPQSTPFTPSVG